jgi:hypothetical protein
MNTKLVIPTLGIMLLGSSALAQADDWDHRGRGVSQYRAWHDDAWRGDSRPEWRHHDQPHYRYQPWSPTTGRAYWSPAPGWHHNYYAHPGYRSGSLPYGQDGVTIILRGRLN